MVKISASIVLYNNDVEEVKKLINNFFKVTEDIEEVNLFLVNNSPSNVKLSDFILDISDKNNHIFAIVPKKNRGFGTGHNLVVNKINSDFHFILNPDITIGGKSEVNAMIHFMENNENYGLLSPLIKYPDGSIQHLLKRESTLLDMALRFVGGPFFKKRKQYFVNLPDGYSKIHHAENVPGSFMMFRTSILKKINGFDEKYFLYMEDSDITKKVNEISDVVFFPDAVVYHEWQRQNRKSIKGVNQMLRSMCIYFNKWGWKLW
ncbi:glycosyltransferase family 2 protein [Pediococcus acidilactici]|nr:glycosyltransferase family 2 protein [Pediococcus acidilactici]KAF0343845.1 glycosyltransferase family 2 protein [Pediococcus acidilactici]KAF0353634.1 glycosyltransferase family 2 protein [Pediococcus acidilactici]KAF0357971.1 glycosyltransferase family 2 protein [Pediococcus acidilactici]KAF0362122.1 glycosyltransferase family 2 protein [Pediococcus acidilactici]